MNTEPAPSTATTAPETAPAPQPKRASKKSATPKPSPFIAVPEDAPPLIPKRASKKNTSPKSSTFTVIDEDEARSEEHFRPAKIPEKRIPESPFKIAEPSMQSLPLNPFESAYAAHPAHAYTQPFAPPPYAIHPYAHLFPQPPFPPHMAYPPAAMPPPAAHSPYPLPSDSSSIRQLELRAIFSVDHQMSIDEILHRCRTLPGIRNIAYLGGQEAGTIESLKTLLAKLDCDGNAIDIDADELAVDFIREGRILLAFHTKGGFAPGVRETLMIVAREISLLA